MEEELRFDELKKKKFAQIQIDGDKPIPFETWGGISPFVADRLGELSRVSVRYFLKGYGYASTGTWTGNSGIRSASTV